MRLRILPLGRRLHEPPLIPNDGIQGRGAVLTEGMVIAIEPMATLGGWRIVLDDDEWTFRTADRSLAAHFEHTIAVTRDGAEVLTAPGR
ncbi:MAG: M24 family metallopeptidase, partial [Patescibacteria group bacterium]